MATVQVGFCAAQNGKEQKSVCVATAQVRFRAAQNGKEQKSVRGNSSGALSCGSKWEGTEECVRGDSPGALPCGSKWEGTEECVRGDSPGVLMYRVDQNHICTGFIRYFWPANPEIDVHIRCKYTVLANPAYLRPNMESRKS